MDWPPGGLPPGRPRRRGTRQLFQIGVAALVLVVILGLRGSEGGLRGEIRDRLAYVLTTEWDYRPVLGRVVDFGLQTVSVNTPLLDNLPYRKDTEHPAPPATEVMKPADLPSLPVSGRVLRGYGWTTDSLDGMERFHPGVDIACAEGTPVKAALAGTVAQVGEDRVYGPYVLLRHGEETYTLYAQVRDIQVKEGDRVKAGQTLAYAGAEGEVGQAGLHFEYREGAKLADPLTKFNLAPEADVHPAGP